MDEARDRVISLRHRDPHTVLGLHHVAGAEYRLRVFRPDCQAAEATFASGPRIALDAVLPGWFEASVKLQRPEAYRLSLTATNGARFEADDAYRFVPTLGDVDLHLFGEGKHRRLWERLGARPMRQQDVDGCAFAVWAPNAESVSVVGDFNHWDGRLHAMRCLGGSGVWELFVPSVAVGAAYKFEIRPKFGPAFLKSDPMARRTEVPPKTASLVAAPLPTPSTSRIAFGGDARPMSIYEVHLGSWKRVPAEGDRPLTYRELARELPGYVKRLGFTHVELLPVAEHPFGGSWGYQVSAYYAPTARFGTPAEFRQLVDALHEQGIGVLVDWVPGHFPRDDFALRCFDGTALYEHSDPRQGEHPDWGTLIFNFGRHEVRNFLIANALYWLKELGVDGLRVDAVASMLYLDYSRNEGGWIPNQYGGRENLESISFFRELNRVVAEEVPGALVMAEESTAFPRVSHPESSGGLGFSHKWNMGWMHDTLRYFSKDPVFRKHHHHDLTFGLLYAFTERFVLPLSHDEVVHGKGSLLGKMPGDDWRRFANLRSLYAWMWAHPGKKLLFMGSEFAQSSEWSHDRSLDWHLLEYGDHARMQHFVASLNGAYRRDPALFDRDFDGSGFCWVQANASDLNVYAFARFPNDGSPPLVCVANLSPVVRTDYRVGLPQGGTWVERLNTDGHDFGGTGLHNGPLPAEPIAWDGMPASCSMTLPPLSVIWLGPDRR